MFRWTVLSGVLLISVSTLSTAQTAGRPTDPVFVRAQTLVSDGNGIAGRALIDSVIAVTPSMAPLYPQALFWRASLAASAADAESDYKHIVVDYPLAPQAADALLRLAQLELARGDREGALGHLQRIPRDYPRSKLLARASYWTARVLFEKNDVSGACVASANALAKADTTEIELRNQIQYQRQRCPSTITAPTLTSPAVATSANGPTTSVTASPSPSPSSSTTPTSTSTVTAKASPVIVNPDAPVGKEKKVADTVSPTATAASTTPRVTAQAQRPTPLIEASDSRPSIVDPTKRAAIGGYSVQVAAYNHNPEAEKLVSTLKKSGYEARVDGSIAPFRVRIGRYATEKEAEDALRRIKAKQMDGFVVRVPER